MSNKTRLDVLLTERGLAESRQKAQAVIMAGHVFVAGQRVIGLPGDTVSFSGGYVYINGQRLEEEYLDQQGGTISPDQSSFTVPEGCLFFLGDNRSGSNDARYWEESYIPVGNVKARVLLAISLTGGSSWQGVRAIG